MTLPVHITSRRLLLRTLVASDVSEAYVQWMNDPAVNRFLESRFVEHTIETLLEFVRSLEQDERHVFAAIVEIEQQRHIGNIKLGPIDAYHQTGDIGILIGEASCWGKGYASEAIGMLAGYAFTELRLEKLTASAYAENEASVKAFVRAGFSIEGVKRSQFRSGDQRDDAVLLGCVRPTDS